MVKCRQVEEFLLAALCSLEYSFLACLLSGADVMIEKHTIGDKPIQLVSEIRTHLLICEAVFEW